MNKLPVVGVDMYSISMAMQKDHRLSKAWKLFWEALNTDYGAAHYDEIIEVQRFVRRELFLGQSHSGT